jgi:HEAT repeat protein
MSSSDAALRDGEAPRLPTGPLPPVTPPTATFILQLFLIPLLIVSIVVIVWLLFSWVAHAGRNNAGDLVKGIERGDNASGQLAFELASLLRSPEPKYDALRHDAALCERLAKFLNRDLEETLTSQDDSRRVMRRMYLCRVLGEFHVPAGVEVLLRAAREERDPMEVQVRLSAIEALAALADHCGPEKLRTEPVLAGLQAASQAADDSSTPASSSSSGEPTLYRPHGELRAVAAYALGVIGGKQATERLKKMLHDTYPNARYNAATGLARSGDAACVGVLREMLDPANDLAVKDESNANDQARKRTTVLLNGIKATLQLAEVNPAADTAPLKAALQNLTTASLENVTIDRSKVKAAAAETVRLIEARQPRS